MFLFTVLVGVALFFFRNCTCLQFFWLESFYGFLLFYSVAFITEQLLKRISMCFVPGFFIFSGVRGIGDGKGEL